jgi:pilus assembly protein TadC
MVLFFALLFAAGVWILLSTVTNLFTGMRLSLRPWFGDVSLADSYNAIQAHADGPVLTIFRDRPLLDRLLSPLLEDLIRLGKPFLGDAAAVQALIVRAGYPKPYRNVADFYAWKILMSLLMLVNGLVLVVVLGNLSALVALGLAVLGFYLPNQHLAGLAKQRSEEMVSEMSFVLDRLSVLLTSGMTLNTALVRLSQAEGGWFIAELKQYTREINSGVAEPAALANIAARNNIPEVRRLIARIEMAAQAGLGLAEVLQVMAVLARERLEQLLLARSRANAVKMVLPVGQLILPAMLATVLAPGVVAIFNVLH